MARQPVGPDAADEQEHHLRHRARGEDEAEVGLRARQLEDSEGERDVRECIADERRRPAEEEEPEAALSEGTGAESPKRGPSLDGGHSVLEALRRASGS
jgi:hypothetical protein